jgi:glycosyltransferase 2 family protein
VPRISPSLQRLLSLGISAGSLAAVAWWVAHQETPRLPDGVSGWVLLLAALAVYGVSVALRGWRWHRIMLLAHIPHRRADAYGLTLVGLMGNNVLPARGGEVLRIGLMGSRTPARRREVLGSIIAERLLDAAILVALFAVYTWIGVAGAPTGRWPATVATAALVVGGLGLVTYLSLRRRGHFERFAETIRPVSRASKIFARREGAPLALLSAVVWTLEGVTLLVIGLAIDVSLTLPDAALIIILASLAAAIPAAPGYAGTFDAGMVLGLSAAGVSGGAAVGFILLVRFVMFVPVTLVGLAVLVSRYGGFKRQVRSTQEPIDRRAPPADPGPRPSRAARPG